MRSLSLLLVTVFLLVACGGDSGTARTSSSSKKDSVRSSGVAQGTVKATSQDYESHFKVRQGREYTKAEKRERKRPSEIPGLTKGQVADMPDVPALPDLFGLHNTEAQLDAHAMILAREDVQNGIADLFTIEQRFAYIRFLWMDEWGMRKELLQSVIDHQGAYAERLRFDAARNAAWARAQVKRREMRKEELERIKRDELPVLTPEEKRLLH